MQYGSRFSSFQGKRDRGSLARLFKRTEFGDSRRMEGEVPRRSEWLVMLPYVRAPFFWFAALLALLCGGIASAAPTDPPSRASRENPPARDVSRQAATAVLFEFARPVPEPFWNELKGELDQNAAPEWPERSLVWMKRREFQRGMEYPEVVQVRLKGRCSGEAAVARESGEGPLGWAYVVDGEIQPVAYVNCDRIAQTLERELRGASLKERREKFARAVSRVVAHELTHIFQQSRKHNRSGLEKAYLTAGALTKEGAL